VLLQTKKLKETPTKPRKERIGYKLIPVYALDMEPKERQKLEGSKKNGHNPVREGGERIQGEKKLTKWGGTNAAESLGGGER